VTVFSYVCKVGQVSECTLGRVGGGGAGVCLLFIHA